jgi:hypothetical protein
LTAQRLKQRDCADQLRLKRPPELGALAQHDVGDRNGVARVALARAGGMAIAMRAPGRDVEHLMPGARQRAAEQKKRTPGRMPVMPVPTKQCCYSTI